MSRNDSASRGFTVAELIVALSISTLTLLSGYELFRALTAAGERETEDLAIRAGIVHGLDRIREDLLHARPPAESQEVVFTGRNPGPEDQAGSGPLLAFYSLCAGSGEGWTRELRQMQHVSYELVKIGDFTALFRRAVPVVGPRDAAGQDNGELILEHVEQIELAFYDGQIWQPTFSSKEKLPAAVNLMARTWGQAWPLSVKLPCTCTGEQP
jgi:hypothetical protein